MLITIILALIIAVFAWFKYVKFEGQRRIYLAINEFREKAKERGGTDAEIELFIRDINTIGFIKSSVFYKSTYYISSVLIEDFEQRFPTKEKNRDKC